ncbi:Endothelin-converting enzyme 1 [Chytriomyces hyalinus]|nr:Endothelin-converting enzyme 1 [Chytriomyces hyalinus]
MPSTPPPQSTLMQQGWSNGYGALGAPNMAVEVETTSSTEMDDSASSSSSVSVQMHPSGPGPFAMRGGAQDDNQAREVRSAWSQQGGAIQAVVAQRPKHVRRDTAAENTPLLHGGYGDIAAGEQSSGNILSRLGDSFKVWRGYAADWVVVTRRQVAETWAGSVAYFNENYSLEDRQTALLVSTLVVACYLVAVIFIYNPPVRVGPPPIPPTEPVPTPKLPDLPPPPPVDPIPPPVFEPAPMCTSKECVFASADILSGADLDVDPCDNFYQYSCGSWIKNHPIPPSSSKEGVGSEIGKRNNKIIKDQLKSLAESVLHFDPVSNSTFTKLNVLFQSCLAPSSNSTAQLDQAITSTIKNQMPLIERSFPVGTPHLRSQNLASVLKQSQDIGVGALFTLSVESDPQDPSTYISLILPWESALLGLKARELYHDPDIVHVYTNVIAKSLEIVFGQTIGISSSGSKPLYHKQPPSEWVKMASEIIWFERELVRILPDRKDMMSHEDAIVTLEDLQTAAPFMTWSYFFRLSLETSKPPSAGTRILVPGATVTYLTRLSELLLTLGKTEALDGYFLWLAVWKWAKDAGPDLKRAVEPLKLLLDGVSMEPIREDFCVDAATSSMGDAVSRLFVERAFADDAVKASDEMMSTIKNSFQVALPTYKWLDKPTSLEAQKKLAAVLTTSGFNPIILDPSYLSALYKNLDPKPELWLENQIQAMRVGTRNRLDKVGKAVDRREALYPVTLVNAAYNAGSNAIIMNAGIMQSPCFSASRPAYLNYGACGSVMGHELTHGFDDSGRKYDASGKSRDWWTPSTAAAFNAKTQCFVDQYSNYTVLGPDNEVLNVNGHLTLGENIADNGGLSRALEAWRTERATIGGGVKNAALPGLQDFSEEQLFFMGYAQLWCSNIRPEAMRTQILTNVHAPPEWRVNGVVSNSVEFSRAFKCAVGSKMNPTDKCKIW